MGSHVMREMVSMDCEVYAMEHHTPLQAEENVRLIKGGIGDISAQFIRDLNPDIIFHCARPKFPFLRKTGRKLASLQAARLNRRLVRALCTSGRPVKLAFASGSLWYGHSEFPADERSPGRPASFARQYHRGERPILEASERGSVNVTVFRFPWLLGPGSWFEWFYIRTMERFGAVPLFGSGNNLMEVIDARDAARLAARIALDLNSPGTLNIRSSRPVTQMELASVVSQISGLPVKDYREIFTRLPESEVVEAFTSSIVLDTIHPRFFEGFPYTSLEDSVRKILEDYQVA